MSDDLRKQIKVPAEYDAVEMQKTFDSILENVQEKSFSMRESPPSNKDGRNGEIRIDEENSKIYVKIKGAWKSASLT
jgi:hypothetical protein